MTRTDATEIDTTADLVWVGPELQPLDGALVWAYGYAFTDDGGYIEDLEVARLLLRERHRLEAVAEHLNGCFSAALFTAEGVTLVGDRDGSIPLYSARAGEKLVVSNDPWRVVMSTDHPNGGSFLAYPEIIHLLMDRTYREDMLKLVHPLVRERSTLADLTREYSLYEICIITRSAPARILGLTQKGHLGPGADADITIYTPDDDKRKMFELPRFVIKSGDVIAEQGEIREVHTGRLLYVAPEYDTSIEGDIGQWFEKYYSVRFNNYPVPLDYLHEHEEVACAGT